MNNKARKLIKLIYSIFVIFILVNIFINTQAFASNIAIGNKAPVAGPIATVVKTMFALAQVFVSGWFVIKFTIAGIQYFTSVAATDKADNKNKMKNTLFLAVITYLGIFVFGKVLGL